METVLLSGLLQLIYLSGKRGTDTIMSYLFSVHVAIRPCQHTS